MDRSAVAAASAAIRRLAPEIADRVVLRTVDAAGRDHFSITAGHDGEVRISGSSAVALVSGFGCYLHNVARGQVSRCGRQVPSLAVALAAPIERSSLYELRVAYNFCVAGYTTPFYDWSKWERELDLLAMSGFNAALVLHGQEAVWLATFQEFGYTLEELLAWIVPPSHQAWQWLTNIHSYLGGTSQHLIARRVELADRTLDRMRELGIQPIFPACSGTVPPGFAERNPGAHVVPQGGWITRESGPPQPDWLDTSSDIYQALATTFFRHQRALFGRPLGWAADLLHEGGTTGDVALAAAAAGIERAMRAADPDYVWFLQAWERNPRPEILAASDHDHLVVVDLVGNTWKRADGLGGAPWVWGILPNYGGRHGLFGSLPDLAAAPAVLWSSAAGNTLRGIGYMGEGVDTNPVVWDLFSDLTWTGAQPFDVTTWLDDWVHARYGTPDPDAIAAWRRLLDTAYGCWQVKRQLDPTDAGETAVDFDIPFAADSLFAAIPSLSATRASPVAFAHLHYDPSEVEDAWRLLLTAATRLAGVDTFDYDLVDVTRQVLDNRGRAMLPSIEAAFVERDLRRFTVLSQQFLRLIELEDNVLATRQEFLLGAWLRDAREWGSDPDEAAKLERDAKTLITIWGERDAEPLTGYGNRSLAGVFATYYRPRWALLFAGLDESMRTGTGPAPVDWWEYGHRWTIEPRAFDEMPRGRPADAARRAAEALHFQIVT